MYKTQRDAIDVGMLWTRATGRDWAVVLLADGQYGLTPWSEVGNAADLPSTARCCSGDSQFNWPAIPETLQHDLISVLGLLGTLLADVDQFERTIVGQGIAKGNGGTLAVRRAINALKQAGCNLSNKASCTNGFKQAVKD